MIHNVYGIYTNILKSSQIYDFIGFFDHKIEKCIYNFNKMSHIILYY